MDSNLVWLLEKHEDLFVEYMTYAPIHVPDVWSSWSKPQLRVIRKMSTEEAEELINSPDGKSCMKIMSERYQATIQVLRTKVLAPYFLTRRQNNTWKKYHIEVTATVPLEKIIEDNRILHYVDMVRGLFYTACGLDEFEIWNVRMDSDHLKFMHQCINQMSVEFINVVADEYDENDPYLQEVVRGL